MNIVKVGTLRTWCADDLPAAEFEPLRVLEAGGPAEGDGARAVARRAVVELAGEIGGLPQRALLGGAVEPAADGMCTVRVRIAPDDAEDGPVIEGALGQPLVVGLPEAYAEVVRAETLLLGGGSRRIVIDRAAHHPVDSSYVAFRAAARLLGFVLQHGRLPPAEQLRAVVRLESTRTVK